MLIVVDNGTRFLDDLESLLRELGSDCVVRPGHQSIPQAEMAAADGFILSGGPLLLDREFYLQTIVLDCQVLLEARAPVLGICLGHQLLAGMHGAGIVRCLEPVRRTVSVQVLKDDPLFLGLDNPFPAWAAHTEIIAGLPGTFEHLASSDHCYYTAIRHRERLRYGVQFHPEASDGAGRRILANFLDICRRDSRQPRPASAPTASRSVREGTLARLQTGQVQANIQE